MALVSYDYGSGSENEEDETSDSAAVIINTTKDISGKKQNNNEYNNKIGTDDDNIDSNNIPEILTHLPKTKESVVTIVEEKLEDFVPKYQPPTKEKKPQKVKITIPALSEFEEEDEPEQKRTKQSLKGSTLLSMLPPVKGSPLSTKSFIPNVLKNKPNKSSNQNKSDMLVPQAVRKKAEQAKMATIKKITKTSEQGSDAESDDDIEVPETFDDDMWQKVCGRPDKPKPQIIESGEEETNTQMINIAPEPVKPYEGLDNAAFKELVGKSKRPVNIKLIDINEEEIVPDKDVWMTKSLTDPDIAPKPAVENPVDPTRKKKHHITYLAEQAKANEQELQSQWSSSKFARNQTRAKYGF